MKILTTENIPFNLNDLPDEIDEDLRFSVLDNSDPARPDFFFMPLIFLESFNSPAIVMNIGDYQLQMPLDWCMAIGDHQTGGDPEILPLTAINERGFDAFIFNPITGFRLEYYPVEIVNVYQEVKWFFPKMKNGQLLSMPLTNDENPPCAFFVKDINRRCEVIRVGDLM